MIGKITVRSRLADADASMASASVPPTWVSAWPPTASRSASHGGLGLVGPGFGVDDGVDLGHAVAGGGDSGLADAVDGAHRGRQGLPVTAGDDDGGVGCAGREGLGETLTGGDGLGLLEELVGPVETGLDLRDSARHDGEGEHGGGDEPGGPLRDGIPDAAPQRVRVGQAGLPDRRDLGPEDPPAEHDERGGQHDEGEEGGDDDADGAREAEPPGGGKEREQEGEQAEHDRAGAGDDGLGGAAQGDGHGLTTVLGDAQLVAVAADEEQGVVGAGTEDEHREDADRRLVPQHVEGCQGVGRDDRGELVGDGDDGQGHEPEHRAAVGDDEQDRDDGCRGGEQAEVGPVEDGGEVGLDGRGAGDLGGQPVGQVRLGRLPEVADDLGGLHGVTGVDRDEDRRRGAVLGDHGRGARRSRKGARLLLDERELLGGERLVAAVEHDGGGPLGLGQLGAQLGGGLAVGAVGEGCDGGRGPLCLADDADDGACAENGHEGDDPGHPLPGDEVCNLAHRRLLP